MQRLVKSGLSNRIPAKRGTRRSGRKSGLRELAETELNEKIDMQHS